MGEVGRRLAAGLAAAGVEVIPVTRKQGWERALGDAEGLRLVCVREEALAAVLGLLRDVPDADIAVVQNGWIRPLLATLPNLSRGLIWFMSKREFFRVLRPTPFCGPRAEHLAALLTAGGIASVAVQRLEFDCLDAEKMGFNCVVGLPLAVHGVDLGEYLSGHRHEARELFEESVTVSAAALGVVVADDLWERFLEATALLGRVRVPVAKALAFRNGAIARLARDQGVPVPVTDRLLAAHRKLHLAVD
jgi:ketopantoate reductase